MVTGARPVRVGGGGVEELALAGRTTYFQDRREGGGMRGSWRHFDMQRRASRGLLRLTALTFSQTKGCSHLLGAEGQRKRGLAFEASRGFWNNYTSCHLFSTYAPGTVPSRLNILADFIS